MNPFRAIVLRRDGTHFAAALESVDPAVLPEGDVTVDIDFSTVNYKDALAITDRAAVVRRWPMVPGIDLAGHVTQSTSTDFPAGAAVLLNGWGVGETHWGGLAQRARVKSDWLLPLPKGLSSHDAMAIGTAGYTAMLCALALRDSGVKPDDGEILVTGAVGGVGSVAIAILSGWGYRVTASTRRQSESDYLRRLGAAAIVDAAELSGPGKPLGRERWAGVVDAVGSHTLANACAATRYGGVVTACGLAQGMDLPASVAPFILRAVRLIGIDSVMAPMDRRRAAWHSLAGEFDRGMLSDMTREIGLADVIACAPELLAGTVRGRVVVKP